MKYRNDYRDIIFIPRQLNALWSIGPDLGLGYLDLTQECHDLRALRSTWW